MDSCPKCGCRLPYFAVVGNCLLRRDYAVRCANCRSFLVSTTPLLGVQMLWISGGVLVVFGCQVWFAGYSLFAALGFWIASFWISAPWLCRFRSMGLRTLSNSTMRSLSKVTRPGL